MSTPYQGPFKYWPNGSMIFGQTKKGDSHVLDVRGWGALTSTMDEHRASVLQDEFGELVARLLNEHFRKNK